VGEQPANFLLGEIFLSSILTAKEDTSERIFVSSVRPNASEVSVKFVKGNAGSWYMLKNFPMAVLARLRVYDQEEHIEPYSERCKAVFRDEFHDTPVVIRMYLLREDELSSIPSMVSLGWPWTIHSHAVVVIVIKNDLRRFQVQPKISCSVE